MLKWQIAPRARKCTQTAQPFAPEEMVWTYLFKDPKEGYRREDVTAAGRAQLEQAMPLQEEPPFSQWQSRFKPAQAEDAEPTAEQKLGAEGLFRNLAEEDDVATLNTRYVLAIMLERRKALKEVDRRETDEGMLLVYEAPKTGEVFLVLDPGLKLADIAAIQEEVASQLTVAEILHSAPKKAPVAAAETEGD